MRSGAKVSAAGIAAVVEQSHTSLTDQGTWPGRDPWRRGFTYLHSPIAVFHSLFSPEHWMTEPAFPSVWRGSASWHKALSRVLSLTKQLWEVLIFCCVTHQLQSPGIVPSAASFPGFWHGSPAAFAMVTTLPKSLNLETGEAALTVFSPVSCLVSTILILLPHLIRYSLSQYKFPCIPSLLPGSEGMCIFEES